MAKKTVATLQGKSKKLTKAKFILEFAVVSISNLFATSTPPILSFGLSSLYIP